MEKITNLEKFTMHKFRHMSFTFLMHYGFSENQGKKIFFFTESEIANLFGTNFSTLKNKYELN